MSSNDADIIKHLKTAKNYNDFYNRITELLNDLGFDAWMYTRLDIPLFVQDTIVSRSFEKMRTVYQRERFEESDLAYHHIVHCKQPIHQSDVNIYLINSHIKTDSHLSAHSMIHRMMELGYGQRYLIPLLSKFGWCSFTVSKQYMPPNAFKVLVANNSTLLMLIARTIDEVGCTQYKDWFLLTEISFNKLLKSKPVELFTLCYEKDISIVEAAKIMGIRQKTTEMHSKKFREMMNAATLPVAVSKAIKYGIIKKINCNTKLEKATNRGTFRTVPR